jgi:hypothetical protein
MTCRVNKEHKAEKILYSDIEREQKLRLMSRTWVIAVGSN